VYSVFKDTIRGQGIRSTMQAYMHQRNAIIGHIKHSVIMTYANQNENSTQNASKNKRSSL
jgi:hypothetical protein